MKALTSSTFMIANVVVILVGTANGQMGGAPILSQPNMANSAYYQAVPGHPGMAHAQLSALHGASQVQLASCESGACGPGAYGPGAYGPGGCADGSCASGACSSGACGLGGLGAGGFGGGGLPGMNLLPGPQAPHGHAGFGGQLSNGQNGPNGSGSCCLPRWFDVSAEWLFWERDFGNSLALSTDPRLNPVVLGTDDLEIEEVSGARITAAYLVGPSTGIEATYLGGFNWESSAQATSGTGTLFSVFSDFGANPFSGFPETDFGTLHRLNYSSEFDSGELNLRRRFVSANCLLHSSFLIGARYVRLADDLMYDTQTPDGALNYLLKTDNDLVGAQIGTEALLCVSPRFKIGGDVKAGVYGNHNKQDTAVAHFQRDAFGVITQGTPLREKERDVSVSFVGEAGLNGIFKVTPRFAVKAGYSVLYVSGVAEAVDNFNTDSPLLVRSSFLNNNGDLFLHGANLGFELAW